MALIALLPVVNAVRLVASAASQVLTRPIAGAVSKPLQQSVRTAMQNPGFKGPTATALNTSSSTVTTTTHTAQLNLLKGASSAPPGMAVGLGVGTLAVTQLPQVPQLKSTSSPSVTETLTHWNQVAQALPDLSPTGLALKAGQVLADKATARTDTPPLTARLGTTPESPRNEGFQIHRPTPGWTISPIPQRPTKFVHTVPMLNERWLNQVSPPGRNAANINTQIEGFAVHTPNAQDSVLLKKAEEPPSTLIIGANGAFAPALAAEAQKRHPEAKVYATSRQGELPENFRIPGVQYIETPNGLADITVDLLQETKPRYVFNLANTSGPALETAFDVNVIQRYKVMQAVDWYSQNVDWQVSHPILSSHSVYKYGRQLNEQSLPDNTSYYGATTYASEFISLSPHSKTGVTERENLDVAVFRIPTLVGIPTGLNFVPSRMDRLQFNDWVKQAATRSHIAVDGPPAVLRPYGYSPDIAGQIFNVMTHPDAQVRNVMPIVLGRPGIGGQALSTEDAVKMVVDVAERVDGNKVGYRLTGRQQRLGDRDITVDTGLYHSLFPDHQATPLETAIEQLYRIYRQQAK